MTGYEINFNTYAGNSRLFTHPLYIRYNSMIFADISKTEVQGYLNLVMATASSAEICAYLSWLIRTLNLLEA